MLNYIAKILAKNFSQVPGNDFKETYSPTTIPSAIAILLNVAFDYQLKQTDITTAYLKAAIEEGIVIKQSEGVELSDENRTHFVSNVKKSLYGLKQSGGNLFLTLKAFLNTLSFC